MTDINIDNNVQLLPLPMPKGDVAGGGLDWTDEEMQDYARANVAHHTVAKDAEIEALRAALEWQGAMTKALLPYQERAVKAEARAERLAEALREVVELDEEDGDSLRNARAISRAALHDQGARGESDET